MVAVFGKRAIGVIRSETAQQLHFGQGDFIVELYRQRARKSVGIGSVIHVGHHDIEHILAGRKYQPFRVEQRFRESDPRTVEDIFLVIHYFFAFSDENQHFCSGFEMCTVNMPVHNGAGCNFKIYLQIRPTVGCLEYSVRHARVERTREEREHDEQRYGEKLTGRHDFHFQNEECY